MKRPSKRTYGISAGLFVATVLSTHWVGASFYVLSRPPATLWEWVLGGRFALPLLAILVAHEAGHFFAARRRGVPASPPMFIPVPITALGTMGAIIGLSRVRRRDAMLEIGAAGPLAGMVVALPVLVVGLCNSEVGPVPTTSYLLEGRSLLYLGLVRAIAGRIGPGQDILLAPEAFAGWAGLLVTMANLVPLGSLDGGHVARALSPRAHARAEPMIHRALGVIGVVVSLALGVDDYLVHHDLGRAVDAGTGGLAWLVWAGMIALINRMSAVEGARRPLRTRSRRDVKRLHRSRSVRPARALYLARKAKLRARLEAAPLPKAHRTVALLTLALFPLLFMPFWLRIVSP